MEVYVSDKFNIRTIEEKDIKNILTLYNQELTTCNCLNTNLYNGLEEMATILDTITHNNNEKYQLLILEDYYKLIGFTLIRKSVKDLYNIDFITIEKQKRNQGHGTILLDVIKELAIEDKSRLKTYTYMGDFFEHNGFYKKSMCAIDQF